jgi:hypothetical protein
LDWAIAGLAMAPAARPAPAVARKLRRFIIAYSCSGHVALRGRLVTRDE